MTVRHERTPARVTWRRAGVLLVGVAVVVAPYLAGVVVPYYVNDLDRLSPAEVQSGAHDPKDLWPTTSGLGGELLHAAGFFSLALTPMGLVGVLVGCGVLLTAAGGPRGWARSPGPTACLVAAGALSVAVLAFMVTTRGGALTAWTLD